MFKSLMFKVAADTYAYVIHERQTYINRMHCWLEYRHRELDRGN